MQREVSLASESAGILQLLRNTADAAISGAETSLRWNATEALLISANAAVLDFHWLVVRRDRDVEHFSERHRLRFWTREEMTAAFEEAGFEIVYDTSYPLGSQDLSPVMRGATSS